MPAAKGTRLVARNGTFYIVWTGNTRGRSTGTGDRTAAEVALAEFIAERARGGGVDGALSVSAALAFYFDEHVKEKVVDTQRQDLVRAHLEAYFGHTPIVAMSGDDSDLDMKGYTAWRRAGNSGTAKKRAASNATIRRELGVLIAAFNYCAATKRIKREHLPFVALPEGSAPRDIWLPEHYLDTFLLACLPGDDATWQTRTWEKTAAQIISTPVEDGEPPVTLPRVFKFSLIASEAAARRRAIESLTKFQVERGLARINFNVAGRRQTKKRRPVVPVSDRLKPWLKRFLEESQTEFVLGSGGSVRTAFRHAVKRAATWLRKAGDDEGAALMARVIPHVLRHTWATLAARSRVPMWEIAGVLGDTLATVTKTYAHHHPDHLRSAVNFRSTAQSNTGAIEPVAR